MILAVVICILTSATVTLLYYHSRMAEDSKTAFSLARMAADCAKGQTIWLRGRLQSRTYIKQLEEGSEERTAFEISAITADRVD